MADAYISESEEEQGTMTHSNTALTGLRELSSSNLTILDKSVFTDSASFIVANPDGKYIINIYISKKTT